MHNAADLRLSTRVFLLLAKAFGRVSNQFHCCAAATLSIDEIKEGIRSEWQHFKLSESEIAEGLDPWEEDLVGPFVKAGESVLVIGSGSGREIIPLGQRGCHVTCVEPASQPFDMACRVVRERHIPATMVEGFFEDVSLSGRFAVVMFSWNCYGLIPDSRRRVDALRKAASLLSSGGHILLSYGTVPRPHPLSTWLAQVVGTIFGSDWRIESGDILRRQGSFYGYCHVFTPAEIASEVAAAGLRVVYRGHFPDDPTMALTAP
jgi:SAM-dependent methyltransferase